MMQNNAKRACLVSFITPAFVDLSDVSVFVGACDPAHPHGDVILNKTSSRLRNDRAPPFDTKP